MDIVVKTLYILCSGKYARNSFFIYQEKWEQKAYFNFIHKYEI
jgi:hypothetical protein